MLMTGSSSSTLPAPLRIGTRGSPLALVQAETVRAALSAAVPELARADATEIITIKTTGDRVQDRPLAEIGGKGLFAKEIETALFERRIDIAVHSLKDMETWLPDGLIIATVLPREDPRDALIAPNARSIDELPEGARIGTSSIRRQAQLLAHRRDFQIVPFRGNVQTRLRKLADGVADATLLATAGLNRLGAELPEATPLSVETLLPAACQGVVAVECRETDDAVRQALGAINHQQTMIRVAAERALLAALDGSCRTPIGALAELSGDTLGLRALIAAPDGSVVFDTAREVKVSNNLDAVGTAEALGRDAGAELRAAAPAHLFEE